MGKVKPEHQEGEVKPEQEKAEVKPELQNGGMKPQEQPGDVKRDRTETQAQPERQATEVTPEQGKAAKDNASSSPGEDEARLAPAAPGPRIVVTGASGFLGRACVAEARRHDLPVLAVTRGAPLPGWADDAGIATLQLDLTAPEAADRLTGALTEDSALIHAAAHLGDDAQALARDTLQANRAVHAAWTAKAPRLVLISSLAVYDTDRLHPGDALRESSALIPLPDATLRGARDPYAGAKRLQEAMFLFDDALDDDWILRPGAIWGPGRSWHALQGFWASKLFVTIGSEGELPLAHVDHVARIAVEAARTPTPGPGVLNVFDHDRPTRARFLKAHRQVHGWPRLNVTVPYTLWSAMVRLLRPVAHRLPGLFREPVLRARMMPLRYPTDRLHSAFPGKGPRFEDLMTATREGRA